MLRNLATQFSTFYFIHHTCAYENSRFGFVHTAQIIMPDEHLRISAKEVRTHVNLKERKQTVFEKKLLETTNTKQIKISRET